MNTNNWVDAAQVVSGFAALAAVWLAVVTARTSRRVPLTDAYLAAWQTILDVVEEASEARAEPPAEDRADLLMRRFKGADHTLSVIEAMLRVRVYARGIRSDLNNLVIDALYDNPDIRLAPSQPLNLPDFPRPEWAECSDEQWLRVVNSIPFASMLISQVWDLPDEVDNESGLMRWYYPTVLQGLDARDSMTAPSAPPQEQLAFFLGAYLNAFLLPWIRDATREALLGRVGLRGYWKLWRLRRQRWRYAPPWRRRVSYGGLTLFSPTDRR